MLEALAAGEQRAGDIVATLQAGADISQPAVSQHLKVLREAALVTVRADGTRRIYAIDPAGVEVAQAWLSRLADPIGGFAQPLDALATEIARGARDRRTAAAAQDPAAPDRQVGTA